MKPEIIQLRIFFWLVFLLIFADFQKYKVNFLGSLSQAFGTATKICLYLILCLWWPLNSSLCGFCLLSQKLSSGLFISFFLSQITLLSWHFLFFISYFPLPLLYLPCVTPAQQTPLLGGGGSFECVSVSVGVCVCVILISLALKLWSPTLLHSVCPDSSKTADSSCLCVCVCFYLD